MSIGESTEQTLLWRELPPHADSVTDAAWSPNGNHVASIGRDRRLNVFHLGSSTLVHTHLFPYPLMHVGFLNENVLLLCDFASNLRSYVWPDNKTAHNLKVNVERASSMSVSSTIATAALGYKTGLIEFVEYHNDRGTLDAQALSVPGPLWQLCWGGAGDSIYVSSTRDGVTLYDYRNQNILAKYPGAGVFAVSEQLKILASAQRDNAINVYHLTNGKRIASLEGSTSRFGQLAFSEDGTFLLGRSVDGNLYTWVTTGWKLLSTSHDTVIYPRFPLSASPTNSTIYLSTGSKQRNVVVREFPDPDLPDARGVENPQYRNCKIVIMGEQGVGKSALSNQLLGRGWRLTESTHGRQVSRLKREYAGSEYHELYLWDLAGQPNYHLIHQLHLDETHVAIIMFDDQAERDPFARPRYWDRALKTAVVNSASDHDGITKFLVAGRIDRGEPHVSPDAIDRFLKEHEFNGYFRTSARTGTGITPLLDAIQNAIRWDLVPSVSSTKLFQDIQQLILDLQTERVHILPINEAYRRLKASTVTVSATVNEFRTCVALLESRGLVRRLSFNDSLLFSPEYLDAYASAIVNQARVDPNGLGSVKEDDILRGRFLINREERLADSATEKDLIIGTLEDIILRQLAFREVTADGAIIVFPSQFTRENPDLPAPDGVELRIRFTGPLQNIYSTTTVRLFYANRFDVKEIWKNGVVIRDGDNRRAGFQISDFADGQGEIALFFEQGVRPEFKRDLTDFVQQHIFSLAAAGTIRSRKVFRCTGCATEFTESQITGRKSRGFDTITCSVCSAVNALSDVQESSSVSAPSQRTALAIADAQDAAVREANVAVGSAMAQSPDIRTWLEAEPEPHVVVVFTDIVSSTQTNNDLGDLAMDEIKEAHFAMLQLNATRYFGKVLKNTGDGVLAIFKHTPNAVQFAMQTWRTPGHEAIKVRVGIHVGRVRPRDNDIFGQTVNFGARVQGLIDGSGVVLSDEAKKEFERIHGQKQNFLRYIGLENRKLKGFDGSYTVWQVTHFSQRYLTTLQEQARSSR